jgi:hypothetical protein
VTRTRGEARVTLNDLYAAQIEAHYFTLLMLGVCTTLVCLAIYISAKIIAEAISQQKIVIREPVYDAAVYNLWPNRLFPGFAQSQQSMKMSQKLNN